MTRLRTHALAMLAVLMLGVLAVGVGEASAEKGDITFKDWTVICDNLRNCEADGFAAEDAEKPAILRLTRSGAPTAPAGVEIVLMTDTDGVAGGAPLTLLVDDRAVLSVPLGGEGTATLPAAQVGPLLGAARNGTLLSVRQGDTEVGVVSLAGMVAALRLVDDEQRRAGNVTAMIAKGSAPASAVPPQPPMPVVRRAPVVAQTGLRKTPPAGVKALTAKLECDTYQEAAFTAEPEVHRLSSDKVLWQVACGAGAYNFTSLLVVVDDKGGAVRLAPVEGVDDAMVVNAEYDPQTRMLSAYDKGRGIGDCGAASQWAWTGQAFVVTRQAFMPVCRGQTDWPVSFQTKVE